MPEAEDFPLLTTLVIQHNCAARVQGELLHLVPMWPHEWYQARAISAARQLHEIPWTAKFWKALYPDEKKLSEPELLKWRVEITRLYRPTGKGKRCPADRCFPSPAEDAVEELAFFHCLMK
ncbi:hypothetical protein WJX75_001875 [Coccomyxa subellipsoidea]|uniref:Uncharacterized protein n=1 Tax=Coccomyxa subellipsoidea TaxID=248742 RepID=A0ABR2YCR0_9CHLO